MRIRRHFLILAVAETPTHTFNIITEDEYVGKYFYCVGKYDGNAVFGTWSIISGSQYASINENGKVTINQGVISQTIVIQCVYNGNIATRTITVSYDNQFTIECANEISGTTGNAVARYNSEIVTPSWSITSGNQYATISNDGEITIISTGSITITATYSGYQATKSVDVIYVSGQSSSTEVSDDGSVTTTTTTTVENQDGSTTETTTSSTTHDDGSVTTTESETTTNQDGSSTTSSTTNNSDGSSSQTTSTTSPPDIDDGSVTTVSNTTTSNADGTSSETNATVVDNPNGSSQSSSTTINYDENGETTGSSTNDTTNNSDGSSTSTTTNYNADGEPTTGENVDTDTSGNVDTQEVQYDENGDPTVTSYTIDTSNNPNGNKELNGDGVNTEYYAFDLTHGFVLDIAFTIDFAHQPANQNENHHNVLTMKRATPEPWYGFQLRQTGTNKYVILGTQFNSGSNINTTIQPSNLTNNVGEYSLRIVYDPTKELNTFVCTNMITNTTVFSSNSLFPDIQELRYLKVTVGYAMDANGNPYRYSAINVSNFSIKKLVNVAEPVISCINGRDVTITCETDGATIYYRLGGSGNFSVYSAPFTIYANTDVYAYAELDNERSETEVEHITYDSGVATPVISCVENTVSITCSTSGATLYYRINQTGNFSPYSESFVINADTVVEAYATLGLHTSNTAYQNCLYDNGIERPTISCDGEIITITCDTPSVDIYYRLGTSGNFTLYTDAIAMNDDVTVQAYADLNGEHSPIATMNCVYDPVIMYAPDITCDGTYVTITCDTVGATIYYKASQEGSYEEYDEPFEIFADTTVYAYATLTGHVSTVSSETCVYAPVHDYSEDYLTLRILTPGTVKWNSIGSGMAKTIEYSLNDGAWTSITASSSTTISVVADDVVRLRGTNSTYAKDKSNYSGFEGGTASFNLEGNAMSLVYGDNFANQYTLSGTYTFCSMFKLSKVVSAENLILPATTLSQYCYRAMFSKADLLVAAPELPATTLSSGCYYYMFENCAFSTAPELLAPTLVNTCYYYMFTGCSNLNYIRCLATSISASECTKGWVSNVASQGTFVRVGATNWGRGNNGIPTNWNSVIDGSIIVDAPTISCDGEEITMSCTTNGAAIYYKLNGVGSFTQYSAPISINADTTVTAYAEYQNVTSLTVTQSCEYLSSVPIEECNRNVSNWTYSGQTVNTPYSVNAIDGHSSNYVKGSFNFETSVTLRTAQPTYLWFQHADQSAAVYVDNVLVQKHWGGYNSFFVDISNNVHAGSNAIKVTLRNNEGNYLAPAAGDFNFNATLGNVKLFTSPVLPATNYGYDGFHVTSTVTSASATLYVRTSIPVGASVVCGISDGTYSWTDTKPSTGSEMTFTTTITNPHLWNGTIDPHLYTITLEIYYNNQLYHRYQRGYGLRYYSYVINDTSVLQNGDPYTGFLLNGSPYLLRGVCMHHDIDGKANALSATDIANDFSIIQELGCNFIRLAHYPHPKEVYDWCDQLGIIVQTEAPCVNKLTSTMPEDYYTHLTSQYTEMVNEHYNHPSIVFWGLSNETTTDDKSFGKAKIEGYTSLIKSLDNSRLVGYVMSHSYDNPSGYYNNPSGVDWFGCNLYVGWYIDQNTNNPSTRINTRYTNLVTTLQKPMALSEYGCGGTQHCHSDDFMTTTTRGNNARHDIEYQMWLHEGHIASIKNYPQLLFTSQWQLFDIAVSNRNEGYTVCLDGENASTDDNLRRLNNKGLVERDHTTKKDTFYLYKAWWNSTPFVHICGKDYTKTTGRAIKCYTNESGTFTLYVNNTSVATATASDNIVLFSAQNFSAGDVIRVDGPNISDTFTFAT